ncbi:MAG: hypothetical protein ACREGJ_04430 [Candidatus Saccharimonadales bacterium]
MNDNDACAAAWHMPADTPRFPLVSKGFSIIAVCPADKGFHHVLLPRRWSVAAGMILDGDKRERGIVEQDDNVLRTIKLAD